jgi:hypothetical protein
VEFEPLFRALNRIHPRSMQVLLNRFVIRESEHPGRSQPSFARFYGISEAASDVLLWRAAVEFEAALENRQPPLPVETEAERMAARALIDALDPPTGSLPLALSSLTKHADRIQAQLLAQERAELESEAYARETWLRRLAIAVVLAIAGWSTFKDELVRWFGSWFGAK